jgi:hypothetical protein
MLHERIVNKMSGMDAPCQKIASTFNSIEGRRVHSRCFEKLCPLVSEILPLSARISPSAILGGERLTKKEGKPEVVLKLAGGLTAVRENARAIDERMDAVEREFEESVQKVDFQKLEKKEKWYNFFHWAVIAPLELASSVALLVTSLHFLLNSHQNEVRLLVESGQDKVLVGTFLVSAFCLVVSRMANSLANPAVQELRESISNLREGIKEMKKGARELVEEVSFFRGNSA